MALLSYQSFATDVMKENFNVLRDIHLPGLCAVGVRNCDTLQILVAVVSSYSFAIEAWKRTCSIMILFIGYVQTFDIFFITSMGSEQK